MIKIYSLLALAVFTYSCNTAVTSQAKESELSLKAVFKGGYSNFENENDSNYYYLVDIHLINNTDSIFEFITYTCSSLINILTDNEVYKFLYHNCSSNHDTKVRLVPKQEFTLPVILYRNKRYKTEDSTKFGFIMLTPKYLFSQDERAGNLLYKMRERRENIIWSKPIEMSTTSFQPYEIRFIINDTTYAKAKYH